MYLVLLLWGGHGSKRWLWYGGKTWVGGENLVILFSWFCLFFFFFLGIRESLEEDKEIGRL